MITHKKTIINSATKTTIALRQGIVAASTGKKINSKLVRKPGSAKGQIIIGKYAFDADLK